MSNEQTNEQVIAAYYEADHAFRMKFATVVARDEFVSLPPDVREARAFIECADEADARATAMIAFEKVKASREERWIAAHEDMYGVRAAARGR